MLQNDLDYEINRQREWLNNGDTLISNDIELSTPLLASEADDELSSSTNNDNDTASKSFCSRLGDVLNAQLLLSDDREPVIPGTKIAFAEGKFSLKLFKFVALTFLSIVAVHSVVVDRQFGLTDRDKSLTLREIWTYNGNLILLDSVVFFCVGRLWRNAGVDTLAFILPMVLCNVGMECEQYFTFLQHTLTLYDMHCRWPWRLWIFALAFVLPVAGGLVTAHVVRAWRQRTLLVKLTELVFVATFFVAPVVTNSTYLHVHHWFVGWLLGMQCNFDTWWSRSAMAWCWGMYVNGIAVYARDPVLSCEYAAFLAHDLRCPSSVIHIAGMSHHDDRPSLGALLLQTTVGPDWRNCTALSYHP